MGNTIPFSLISQSVTMRFQSDTEIESSIIWETLPYTRRHSQRSAARVYQIGEWTMEKLMELVFLIVGSEWSIALEITSKNFDLLKMC
ncbi:hypothetical protein C0J52_20085 [Blattella germanica]|nr:hypothetical protein C0J52_20085 [Blattella germanica]